MTTQRYSTKEALNRIVRSWLGIYIPSDVPNTLSGSILSEDEAFSFLAELFEDSLPGETPTIPDAVRATIAEAIVGTNNTKAVTPAGLAAATLAGTHEYGQIYTATGTVTVGLSTSWTKITGSFQNNGLSSTNILPEQDFSHIIINEVGVYFVAMQLSFSGSANAVYECAVYRNGVRQEQVRFKRKLNANADVGSASAFGAVQITGTAMALEIFGISDGSNNFTLEAGQFYAEKVPG